MAVLILFYDIFYVLGLCVLLPLVGFSKKYRYWFFSRLQHSQLPGFSEKTVWVHFASAGEFEQALTVIDSLSQTATKPLFLTYFSPTAKNAILREQAIRQKAGEKIPWVGFERLPFDISFLLKPFIRKLNPSSLILIHQELWPNLIYQSYLSSISLLLMAADKDNKSLLQKWFLKFFKQVSYEDPRISRVLSRKERIISSQKEKAMIFASIWPSEMRWLRPTFKYLLKTNYKIILVPHEPHPRFIRKIQDWFEKEGKEIFLWSQLRDLNQHTLVDTVGELFELYSKAEIAFVGGSFRGKVHSVLEPAVFHIPIVTGPFIYNSSSALRLQKECILKVCKTSDELLKQTRTLIEESDEVLKLKTKSQQFFQNYKNNFEINLDL